MDRVRRIRDEKKIWKKPLPPTPFLIHLNVLARTQYADEYLLAKNAIKNESEKYVDVLLGQAKDKPNEKLVETSPRVLCSSQENDLCSFVLSDLIR